VRNGGGGRAAAETAKPIASGKPKQKRPSAAEIEAGIHSVEAELVELSTLLSTEEVARDKDRLFELSEKYQALDDKLADLYSSWEAALRSEERRVGKEGRSRWSAYR